MGLDIIVDPKTFKSLERGTLLSALFVEVFSNGDFLAVNVYSYFEAVTVFKLEALHYFIVDLTAVLLAIFKQLTLVVIICVLEIVDIKVPAQDLADNDTSCGFKPFFKINGANQCFKGIAFHGITETRVIIFHKHHIDTHIVCNAVESLSLDDLGPHFRKESFVAVWVFFEKIFRYDGAEHRVSEIFKSFIAGDGMKLGFESRFVAKGLFKDVEVAGRKPDDVCNTPCKLFIVRYIMIVKTSNHKKLRLH